MTTTTEKISALEQKWSRYATHVIGDETYHDGKHNAYKECLKIAEDAEAEVCKWTLIGCSPAGGAFEHLFKTDCGHEHRVFEDSNAFAGFGCKYCGKRIAIKGGD